eukprot:397474_1
MTKRTASELTVLDLDTPTGHKKRKLSVKDSPNNDDTDDPMNGNNHNDNANGHDMNLLCNSRQSFLRSKRKWIQYRRDINHQTLWHRYSKCMDNVYSASFPDLHCLKIGNLITFRKNTQFEFMTGVIMRAPNTNPLSIYTESQHKVCIKLLPDSLSTQTINRQLCKINKSKTTHMINTEQDVYSLIPKQTFNFEYSSLSNTNTNHNGDLRSLSLMIQKTNKRPNNSNTNSNSKKKDRRIVKKDMKFEHNVICIDIADYEVFEHREIVWSQLDGFEWHPSQILFKWKNGERISPCMAKQQFGLLFILVAFFDVHQTAKIRLSQRHLLPFYDEPNLDILGRTRKDVNKYNTLTTQISNAMILATLQQKINNRLHAQYHTDIHIKNALSLKRLCIPKQNWLFQKVLIFNIDGNNREWKAGRVMYYTPHLDKHFIVFDDNCAVQWLDMDHDVAYMDWCDDTQLREDRLWQPDAMDKSDHARDPYVYDDCRSDEVEIHTLNGQTVHGIKEIHGYGVDECSTNRVALSTRFIAHDTKNCNRCWICQEVSMINVAPVCTVNKQSDPIISIHCICCRRRAHVKCLQKAGISREMLKKHLLAIHCDECKACALCKRQVEPQCIVEWIKRTFDVSQFIEHHFVQEKEWRKQHMIECNLCRRNFHKKCLPNAKNVEWKEEEEHELWLCFDCRVCRCCNGTTSIHNEWHEGYTLCSACFASKDDICKVCFKRNKEVQHEPFWIECHECKASVHLSCSPYSLDELFVMQCRKMVTYYICLACNEKRMQRTQFNVLRYLITNDNESGMVIKHIHSILMLRTHVLSGRMTLLHFVNVFQEIWSDYDAQTVQQMMDFICEVVAKYFNHFYTSQLQSSGAQDKQLPIQVIRKKDGASCSYECRYVSKHEVLILNDICSACGSSQDAHHMIICKRCGLCVHSYCIRSNIDFEKTDNTWYCYSCVWYFYENKVNKMARQMVMKQKQNEQISEWKMKATHLKELFELLQKNALTEDALNAFILNHEIPLWIKPLLFDVVNDAQCFTKYRKRMTTKAAVCDAPASPPAQSKPDAPPLSALYCSVEYQDGATLKDNRTCEVCKYDAGDRHAAAVCGRLLPVQFERRQDCAWIHSKCALSSTDCDVRHSNSYGSNMICIDMTDTLNRALQYKCHICSRFGASMHCSVTDCTLSYHYPCIVTSQMYDEDWRYNDRPFFCNMHKMHFNNNHYTFGDDVKIIDTKRNTQNLYDECLMLLYDRNNMMFVSHSQSHAPSKAKQLFEIAGNTVIKSVKDKNGEVVIHQVYDTFWSYCNVGKRTQFVYESYRSGPAAEPSFLYKLIAMDDPMSSHRFCGRDANKLFQKLIQKYPKTFEAELLFKPKYDFFL